MAWFNRLSATLFASIERLVAPIENHDAVVEAAIRDAGRAVTRAKVRLGRLQRESAQLQTQLTKLEEDTSRWVVRAKELAPRDEDAALECLKRRRGTEARATALRVALTAQADTTARLTRDIADTEQRISTMHQQRHLLRTRESAAAALSRVAEVDLPASALTQTLARWEVRIAETEIAAGNAVAIDPLEVACVAAEERHALLAELAALTALEEGSHE